MSEVNEAILSNLLETSLDRQDVKQIYEAFVASGLSGAVEVISSADVTASVSGAQIPDLEVDTKVFVTSSNADHIVILPAPTVGRVIVLIEESTVGYEIRSSSPATIAINDGTGTNAESAIPASNIVVLVCASSTKWVGTKQTLAGVTTPLEAAA